MTLLAGAEGPPAGSSRRPSMT